MIYNLLAFFVFALCKVSPRLTRKLVAKLRRKQFEVLTQMCKYGSDAVGYKLAEVEFQISQKQIDILLALHGQAA